MIIEEATQVLRMEAKSILKLIDTLGSGFEALVESICSSSGRVIISGIGKSGLIGRKIVATLISTGTNALFLHPVEAMHGDLGIVSKNDLFLAISNSGETQELNILLPTIKTLGCKMAAFTGNPNSTMAGHCDIVIHTGVESEACPLNLTPTCSTTAQLAMGDALAVVLIQKKKFKTTDFKRSHPGGALGQRLSCPVGEIMFKGSHVPTVLIGSTMADAIIVMEEFRLGAVLVSDKKNRLKGIITDGDIRHCIAKGMDNFSRIAIDTLMTKKPLTTSLDTPLYDALNIMEKHQITVLPVTGKNKNLEGMVHLHDILGKGAFTFNGS